MTTPTVTVPIDPTDPARIAALALLALGTTPRAVADALTAAGFTGQVESCESCPVARYLLATDPRLTGVAVSDTEICLDLPDESVYLTTPDPVAGFITRFDTGGYPQLLAAFEQANTPADPGTTSGSEG